MEDTKEKKCGTCLMFNGEIGDGTQFCDEKEDWVSENSYCYRYCEDTTKLENSI